MNTEIAVVYKKINLDQLEIKAEDSNDYSKS